MKAMESIIGIAFVGFVIIFGVMYVTSSMVSLDRSVNVTGTEYEETYDSVTDTSIATLSLLNMLPWLVGIVGVLIALAWLKNAGTGKGGW